MEEILKEALLAAEKELLKNIKPLITETKYLALEDYSLQGIINTVSHLAIPLKSISMVHKHGDGLYAEWEETREKTKSDKKREMLRRFTATIFPIIQPILLKNGYKKISYNHAACKKFLAKNNIILLTHLSLPEDYKKITIYDLYTKGSYNLIEQYLLFHYVKKKENPIHLDIEALNINKKNPIDETSIKIAKTLLRTLSIDPYINTIEAFPTDDNYVHLCLSIDGDNIIGLMIESESRILVYIENETRIEDRGEVSLAMVTDKIKKLIEENFKNIQKK